MMTVSTDQDVALDVEFMFRKIRRSTVARPPPIATVYGQSVTLTATVAVTTPGAGNPTGTVTFMDGTTTLGTGSPARSMA